MNWYEFTEEVERMGALYKWYLFFGGASFGCSNRFVEHCLNVGIPHSVRIGRADFSDYYELLRFARDVRGKPFERFGFYFNPAARDAHFVFENSDDAFIFTMSVPEELCLAPTTGASFRP